MGQQDDLKLTNIRPTDELESDDTNTPITKRILLYGWDGSAKVLVSVDASGKLGVTI